MRDTTHILKCHPQPFVGLWIGLKTFELRKNDRNYRAGDALVIQEFDPDEAAEPYSGRQVTAQVTHILYGPVGEGAPSNPDWLLAIQPGWCIMSLRVLSQEKSE